MDPYRSYRQCVKTLQHKGNFLDFLLQIGWLVRGDREMPAAYWGESFRSGLLYEPPNISAPQTQIFESTKQQI